MSIDDATPSEWDALKADKTAPEFKPEMAECIYISDEQMKELDERLGTHFEWKKTDGYDSVERPMHYDGQVECIEYIRDRLGHEGFIAYCWGSVIKYQHRWKEKGGIESLRKCRWFLNRLIQEEATGRFDG